jgi:hypothetical protein
MIEFTVAFLGVFLMTLLMKPISNKIGLVDRPTGRKQHNGCNCSGQVFLDSKLSLFSAAAGLKPLL